MDSAVTFGHVTPFNLNLKPTQKLSATVGQSIRDGGRAIHLSAARRNLFSNCCNGGKTGWNRGTGTEQKTNSLRVHG
jgi:hypothetical protein